MKTRLNPFRLFCHMPLQDRLNVRPSFSISRMTGVLFFLVLFSPIPVQADFETIAVPMTLEYDLRIPKHRLPLFSKVVMATAWQESCFRPFVVKNDEITYLRSYNQTSVGIMQINERVWRGIYDLQKLRNACPAG